MPTSEQEKLMGKLLRKPASRNGTNGRALEPAWDVALLFPPQGEWTDEDYLDLPGNRLIELCEGRLEFLPMPTTSHQWIALVLCECLKAFVWPKLGWALPAPLRVRLWPGRFR